MHSLLNSWKCARARRSRQRRANKSPGRLVCAALEILEPRILLATVSFQDGTFPTANYAGTQDTKIRGDFPDRVFGSSKRLEIDGNPDIATLLKWDVGVIPAGSTVVSASINVDVIKTSSDTFNILEVFQPWVESETTFNLVHSGMPWESPGAQGNSDRGVTALGTITAPDLGIVAVDLNDAGLAVVQSWIRNPADNQGILFQKLRQCQYGRFGLSIARG